ncbi:MAG TPA: hypothetical protein PKB10_09150, partial [Tepidisphaeraceae bacterium]|nr:hypothetical protein [Tepidisphaeraceae bacterium]
MTRSGAQFAQADATRQAYDDMRLYRRAVMHLPMGDHQDVVLDIFEVAGGKRHDWMTNGVADYDQVVESSLSFQRTGQPVADDGRVIDDITDPALSAGRTVRGRDLAGVYAAFRNAGIGSVKQPWHVTMRPGEVLPEGVPGAGWRATFTGPRPGLRLHQLAPLDATGIVAQAPRHRYPEELRNPREARLEWANRLMPKIIVRREGDNLQSTFVAAWEPFLHQPWIKQARIVQSVPADRGVGVIIEGEHGTARAIYRKPEAPAEPLTVDGLTTDARFAAVRNFKEQTAIDLSEGTRLQTPELRLRVRSSPAMEITAHRPGEQPGDRDEFDVAGDLSTITASARGWVVFRQTGESARWLPLQSVQPQGANEGKLTLTRDGGFRYDPKLQRVRETYYPFRIETAPARLHVPVSVSITRSPDGSDAQLVKVQSSHALSL